MKGMLAPKYREVVLGHAEVRETYKVSSVGTVAGCYVQDGKTAPGLLRPGGPGWHRGPRGRPRLPAAVQGLRQGGGKERYECGLTVEKFNDIKLGDIIEGYTMEEIPR